MPKRKRPGYGREELDPAQELEHQRAEVERKLVHGKKLLNRALKTARGFERQKLGKRIRLTKDEQGESEVARLQRELDSLKTLDFAVAVEVHLYKALLRAKDIQKSGLLPTYVKSGTQWGQSSPEALSAITNVTARLYNTKPVKETMSQIMGSIYDALGIQRPSSSATNKTLSKVHQTNMIDKPMILPEADLKGDDASLNGANFETLEVHGQLPHSETGLESEPGFESEIDSDDAQESNNIHDMRVVGSSDEGSGDDVGNSSRSEIINSKSRVLGENHDFTSSSSQNSLSPSPPTRSRVLTKRPQQISSKKDSTFLPTLMGGYWSGSESATDEEEIRTQKKNRPGQQARRALWERKYGKSANHLKGQESRKSRDRDWDPKRGARSAEDSRFRQVRGNKTPYVKSREVASGENRVVVKSGIRGMGKKDDAGPLHPSWEAAKKAKEAKKTAIFEGKKVVFDR